MEENKNDKVSEEYKRWFNRGYHLRSTMPEIFEHMTVPPGEPKEITEAFEAGRKQFEKEYGLDKERDDFRKEMRDHLKQKRQSKDRGRG